VNHELIELCKSQDFARVDFATEKYRSYPDAIRPAWQDLMRHRKDLLENARELLEKVKKGGDPTRITEALASVDSFGNSVAAERVALQARWSELVHVAHKEMLSLAQNRQATEEAMELKLAQFAEYPRDVDEIRNKLFEKSKHLQKIKQELTELCASCDSPTEILAALKEFMLYGNGVVNETDALQTRFRELIRNARTDMRTCIQNPASTISQMEATLARFIGFPDDVAQVRQTLAQKLDGSKTTAKERLARLMYCDSIPDIDRALAEYGEADAALGNAPDRLQQHRLALCLAMSTKLQDAMQSLDLRALSALLIESAQFGDDLAQERDAASKQCDRILEKLSAKLQSLAQSDDFELVEETLQQCEGNMSDVRPDYEALQRHRDQLLETTKAHLRALRTTEDPAEISAALDAYDGYGEHIDVELRVLRERFVTLVEQARAKMNHLTQLGDAQIREVSASLTNYRYYPEDVNDARSALALKHEQMLKDAQQRLTELLNTTDIDEIDGVLRQMRGAHENLDQTVDLVERHRTELVRSVSVRLQAALGYDEPGMITSLLDQSNGFEDDVHAEREALKGRYTTLVETAKQELEAHIAGKGSDDYDAVSASLAKYEEFPGEVKQRWQEVDAHRTRLRQDTLARVQRALTSRDTKEVDAVLVRVAKFGADLEKYRELLVARRAKLLDMARQGIRQALTSTDLETIDETFAAHAHLVGEFPKVRKTPSWPRSWANFSRL
jgi:hypothetical protein